MPVRLEADNFRRQPTQGAAPYTFPWAWQGRPVSSSPAVHSSEELPPSSAAASGYARSSVSTAWTQAAAPGGEDPATATAGGGGATGGPEPRGRGGGAAGPLPLRCAPTASRSARPCARTSGDWAGHSHTQCPKWPQKQQAPRRRAAGVDSDEPAPPAPRGAGAPPRGSRGGRSEYGNTVPARGGTGVPGARVPRPRPTPVRTGYNSRRSPHARCCYHPDAGGRLSTGSTGASFSDPRSGGATDAARKAAHLARSASVP